MSKKFPIKAIISISLFVQVGESVCGKIYFGSNFLRSGERTIKACTYTYVLMCNDEKMYIGYLSNLKKRIERHQKGEVFATKGRRPVHLIFYEAFLSSADAKRREKYFKTSPGHKALRLMLREYLK